MNGGMVSDKWNRAIGSFGFIKEADKTNAGRGAGRIVGNFFLGMNLELSTCDMAVEFEGSKSVEDSSRWYVGRR